MQRDCKVSVIIRGALRVGIIAAVAVAALFSIRGARRLRRRGGRGGSGGRRLGRLRLGSVAVGLLGLLGAELVGVAGAVVVATIHYHMSVNSLEKGGVERGDVRQDVVGLLAEAIPVICLTGIELGLGGFKACVDDAK